MDLRSDSYIRVLCLSSTEADQRLSLLHSVVSARVNGHRVVAIVSSDARLALEAALGSSADELDTTRILAIEDLQREANGAADLADRVSHAIAGAHHPGSHAPGTLLLVVELDLLLAGVAVRDEIVDYLNAVVPAGSTGSITTREFAVANRLPDDLPDEFFTTHLRWERGGGSTEGDGSLLEQAVHALGRQTAEDRRGFLVASRGPGRNPPPDAPAALGVYRRGILLLDPELNILYASDRAARLVERNPAELTGRSIAVCLEGVDLLSLRHECSSETPGSPFVLSWRLGPGRYEQMDVTIDPVVVEDRTVGLLVSFAPVEQVRGARAVYRETANDAANPSSVEPLESLHGAQITRREHEVLLLILARRTNREIAHELDIADVTVKKHLTSIYRKLGVASRVELFQGFQSPRTDQGDR